MDKINRREWQAAIALALGLKLFALISLFAGWKLVDRALYRNDRGQVVDLWMTRPQTSFLDNLANFDGAWFIRIAAIGYQRLARGDYDLEEAQKKLRVMDRLGYDQARWPPEPGCQRFDRGYAYRHWPLFSWLLRIPLRLGADPVWAGVVLSNLATLGYALVLFFLARKDLPRGAAMLCVALSQFHPGGYSLSGVYNESLFLLLATGAMLAGRTRRWWLAGGLAMLAAMTRIFGLVLAAPLLYEWLQQRAEQQTGKTSLGGLLRVSGIKGVFSGLWQWPGLWWILLVPAGTAAVLLFFQLVAGDAFIWTRVHEANVYGHVNWPWLMLRETYRKGWVVASKELPLHALLFLVLVLSVRKVRGSYWLWMLLFFLYHTSNGNHSYLRYQIQCMPMFVALSRLAWPHRWLWPGLLFAFLVFFVFFGTMFINAYWVA